MNWYDRQLELKWLKKKRVPKGGAPLALMSGVRYRTPLNDMGHILGQDQIGEDDPIFLCGRSVYLRSWYADSGAHAKWGPDWYVLADGRKGGECKECARRWKDGEARREYDRKLRKVGRDPSPITQAEWEAKRGEHWEREMKQLTMHANWVASMIGGEVVEDEQE